MVEANKVTGVGLRHIAGHTTLKDLTLRLEREPMTLNSLGTLTGLETLRIDAHWLRLPDEELANLTPLKNLQTLSLDRCRIGDRGVAHLAHLTGLRELELSETRVTDDGLAFLRGLRGLRSLRFVGAITERGLHHIAALPALKELRIGSYLPLSDEAVAGLAERMPSLKRAQNTSPRQKMSLNDGLLRRGRREQRGPFDALEGRAAPALNVREWVNAGDDLPRLDRLRGNVVLLGFWGPRNTWARHIVPRLNEVRDRYARDGLVVLGIHATGAPKQVVGMVEPFDVSWPVGLDRRTATFRAYGVERPPSFYLIDRRGTLRVADLYWEDINRAVEKFLAEPRPPL